MINPIHHERIYLFINYMNTLNEFLLVFFIIIFLVQMCHYLPSQTMFVSSFN